MDRRRARAGALTAATLPLLLGASADRLPMVEARWLAPAALYDGLTREPAECIGELPDPQQRRAVASGRAAFSAPLLLGGQAARAGLACASCHRGGRTNPAFRFPGLSGAPGTADVTSSLMSKARGDGTFNPRPIPDLAGGPRRVSRDPANTDLERFIRGLIVEEFDGPEPPAAVLQGLAAYVRAMGPAACPASDARPITLDRMLAEVDAATSAALGAAEAGDGDTARLLVAAARSMLGRIDQRFEAPSLAPSRSLLSQADRSLQRIRTLPPASAGRALRTWRRTWPARLRLLRREEARSLFSPARLRARIGLLDAASDADRARRNGT